MPENALKIACLSNWFLFCFFVVVWRYGEQQQWCLRCCCIMNYKNIQFECEFIVCCILFAPPRSYPRWYVEFSAYCYFLLYIPTIHYSCEWLSDAMCMPDKVLHMQAKSTNRQTIENLIFSLKLHFCVNKKKRFCRTATDPV